MSNDKSIIEEVNEVTTQLNTLVKDLNKLTSSPGFKRVMEFGQLMEAFAKTPGAPVWVTGKPVITRNRRTKAEIEAEKAAAAAKGEGA